MYTHTQYLHMRVHAYAVFTLVCVFTCVHACMANVASMLASYLPFSISYNATVLVTLFFPYRALATHQRVEDKIAKKMESTGLIL